MPEPINPQDHNVDAYSPTTDNVYDIRETDFDWARKEALIEAIHQTFERDANDAARYQNCASECKLLKEPVPPYAMWAVDRATADPDTEIDRLARLIVDGEYRRRKDQGASK
jgi:hypothetical protein